VRRLSVPLLILALVVLFAGAFWIRAGRFTRQVGQDALSSCDSAHAARVVTDSLAQGDPFRSQVLRFAREPGGVRIVTMPDSSSRMLDGMAIVHVDAACRILSITRTDSA
jgi:hypothetical protein